MKQTNPKQQVPHGESGISLISLLLVLADNKAMICIVTFVSMLLAVGYTLMLSDVYSSSAKILPPQQRQSSNSAWLGQFGGLAGLAGSSMGVKNPADIYLAMLKSRSLMEKIVARYNLQEVYKTGPGIGAVNALAGNSAFAVGKDGIITIEVIDLDPKRATDIANAFVDELDKMIRSFIISDAARKRAFFEHQMQLAKENLTEAEMRMDSTPSTSLKYLDTVRSLKHYEAIWGILAKQFEMAKLDEAKDSPLLQILDKATIPEKRIKPNRSRFVMLATLLAFFVVVLWALLKEPFQRVKGNIKHSRRWEELLREIGFSQKLIR